MPRLLLLLAVVLVGCSNPNPQSGDSSPEIIAENTPQDIVAKERSYPVRYAVKEGQMAYNYSGIQTGKETVYFTDYGMVEIKFTDTQRDNPFKSAKETISITTLMRDSSIYVVDRLTMNARKINNALLYEEAEKSQWLDLNEVAEQTYVQNGGAMVGIDTLLGLPCEKWVIKKTNTTEWRWRGMMIKTYVQLKDDYVQVEATSVDTSATVSDSVFELSSSVNIQDGMSMKEWIEELSKPIKRRQRFDKQGNMK